MYVVADCYAGDGRSYAGPVNVTRGGLACQTWSSQSPQRHRRYPEVVFPPAVRPGVAGSGGNACRNPVGEESQPWCYTSDPKVRWDYCDVPKCPHGEFAIV